MAGITVTAVVNGGGEGQVTTTTLTDGSYAFTGLDVGAGRPYALRFRDPSGACLPLDYDAEPSTPATLDMVKVVAGQTTTADAVLRRTATLSGVVRNTAGAALPGVAVHARLGGSAQGELTTTTGADGSYAFTGLDVTTDRTYALSFSDASGHYLPLDYDADPATTDIREMVTVVAEQTTTADAVLRRSCTLGGVVTDSRTGRPVVGVLVEPEVAPGQPPEPGLSSTSGGLTDAAGAYTITGVPEGVYVLACRGKPPVYGLQYWPAAPTAETGTPITLTPAAPSAVADVVLRHDDTRPTTAALNSVRMRARGTATLRFRVTDAYGSKATVAVVIATTAGKVKARVKLGVRAINVGDSVKWRPGRLTAGRYTWWVTATDLAGNTQSKVVKKALVLTR